MFKYTMTDADRQKLAGFIDLADNFLTSGYKSGPIEYIFKQNDIKTNSFKSLNSSQESDSLEKIASEIKACKNCLLAVTRKNTVPGEGTANPLVLVIGEGPGAEEDRQGRPFVGAAGQLLDKMLGAINLSRTSNCFIANSVKCRPPDNRDPHPEEREACAHFLQRQIAVLKPKFILLVGVVAAQCLLNTKDPVGKLHGKFIDYKCGDLTIPLMVTYHPAWVLRNEENKRPVWEDLKKFKSRIDS